MMDIQEQIRIVNKSEVLGWGWAWFVSFWILMCRSVPGRERESSGRTGDIQTQSQWEPERNEENDYTWRRAGLEGK